MMLLMLILATCWLKIKAEFNKRGIKYKIGSLRNSVHKQEYELIKEHLVKKEMMDIENIKNFICHYRNYMKNKVKKAELISILSLVMTILFLVIDDNGLKIDIINKVLPHVLTFLVIYALYGMICYLINALKGEDGMYERLEEIFSEILVELINDKNKKTKSTNSRVKRKKVKKSYKRRSNMCEIELDSSINNYIINRTTGNNIRQEAWDMANGL